MGVPAGRSPLDRPVTPPPAGGTIEVADLGPFTLASSDVLPSVHLAWRHDGPWAPAPQVLVVHALTGSADAAGDWWAPLIGPGKAIDTDRYGVLSWNLLGGRYGSTGPASIDPATGEPWGVRFPAVDTRDQARSLWLLADALGIDQFALVTGGSLGGMVVLEIGIERPHAVGRLLPIAAPAATGPLAIAWNHLQVRLIERLGHEGLELARQLAMTTYRSEADFEQRFARERKTDGRWEVVSYLEHQGAKLRDRFDPDTYRVLATAMDLHDIGRDRGGVRAALARLAAAGVPLTALGIEDDILYGPRQVRALVEDARAAGIEARYAELRSTKGHDAFLVEWDQLTALLRAELAEPERPR